MKKILAFSGSARASSFNQRLVAVAAAGAEKAGAEVSLISLADYPMPLFDEDLESEQGMPEAAKAFKILLTEADGLLIASPEYNSAFSPLLKNAIDWASRPIQGEPPMGTYKNKSAAIMAASPGGLGGMRGLVFLRMLLNNLGVLVIPEQQTLPVAHDAFNEDGSLVDESKQASIELLGSRLVEVCVV
ncbi:MAG: NAD(P)H-dependent oxidoreductase [Agarilytica sp.]